MSEIHDDGMKLVINGKQQDLSDLCEASYILWIVPAEFSFDVMEYRRIIPNRLLFDNIHAQSVTVRPDNGIINTLFANNLKYKGQSADGPIVAALWPLEKADNARWIEKIIDPDMRICNIALPGTHDSAAINKAIHTPYACQDRSIEEQLNGGIRLLDIRIKVDEERDGSFRFVTCHGKNGLGMSMNEYESLQSVLFTCKKFLEINNNEFIVMSLKFDDITHINKNTGKPKWILDYLEIMLDTTLPGWKKFDNYQVRDVYGKVVVINRLYDIGVDVSRFGEPWRIDESGYADFTISKQHICIQDYYDYKLLSSFGSKKEKLKKIYVALSAVDQYDLVVNYCSYITGLGFTTDYTNTDVRNMLLKRRNREKNPRQRYGWFFIDYAFRRTDEYDSYSGTINGKRNRETLVDVIIDLNRGYHFYPLRDTDYVFERTNYIDPDFLLPT